jgi:hypothetical protein
MKRKVYITVGRSLSEHELRGVDVEQTYHISELIRMYPKSITYPFGYKPEVIADFLDKTNGDVLIFQALDTLSDYMKFKEVIEKRDAVLEAVFWGIPKTEGATKYADFFKKHSRWLDYSPEEVEQLSEKHHQELILLAQQIKADGVEIHWLAE